MDKFPSNCYSKPYIDYRLDLSQEETLKAIKHFHSNPYKDDRLDVSQEETIKAIINRLNVPVTYFKWLYLSEAFETNATLVLRIDTLIGKIVSQLEKISDFQNQFESLQGRIKMEESSLGIANKVSQGIKAVSFVAAPLVAGAVIAGTSGAALLFIPFTSYVVSDSLLNTTDTQLKPFQEPIELNTSDTQLKPFPEPTKPIETLPRVSCIELMPLLEFTPREAVKTWYIATQTFASEYGIDSKDEFNAVLALLHVIQLNDKNEATLSEISTLLEIIITRSEERVALTKKEEEAKSPTTTAMSFFTDVATSPQRAYNFVANWISPPAKEPEKD